MGFIPEKWFTKPNSAPAPLPESVPVVRPIEGEVIPLKWADAAMKLGIKLSSVKVQARRNDWHRTTDSEGRALVFVPVSVLEQKSAKAAHARLLKKAARADLLARQAQEVRTQLIGKMDMAERLGVSYYVLNNYMDHKDFPMPVKMFNRRLMWRISEVDEWNANVNQNKERTNERFI
jgi:predicted DNA-binding transcriptional regulator AlpA